MRKYFSKVSWISLVIGFVAGFLVLAVIRFATYNPQHTHYHANFAVYINGDRQQFKGQQYYQDVAACAAYNDMTPEKRVHMHNNINDVVHVHDHAVTWGAFFQNLGWNINADYIKTDTTLYQTDDTREMTFILNGKDQPDITNKVIGDEDQLLISYGQYDKAAVQKQFDTIAKTAEEHDHTQDPASCSGSETVTFKDRLKHIFDTNGIH
jgi:predicted lactoylglutathione lyase